MYKGVIAYYGSEAA